MRKGPLKAYEIRPLEQVNPFPVEILQCHEWVIDVFYHCSTLHASPVYVPKNPIKDRTMS
ncbi:protein of unknown function [Enterobacter cancerogenus]|nr:protein of unknown function [Enterobacter cancerogenus]